MTRTNYNCCKIILFLLCTFLMGANSQAETSREYTCALEKYVTINKNIMDWTYVKGEKFSLSIKENVAFLNDNTLQRGRHFDLETRLVDFFPEKCRDSILANDTISEMLNMSTNLDNRLIFFSLY